jgi:hypothetical protein
MEFKASSTFQSLAQRGKYFSFNFYREKHALSTEVRGSYILHDEKEKVHMERALWHIGMNYGKS